MRSLNLTVSPKKHQYSDIYYYGFADSILQSNIKLPWFEHLLLTVPVIPFSNNKPINNSNFIHKIYAQQSQIGEHDYFIDVSSNIHNCYKIVADSVSYYVDIDNVILTTPSVDVMLLTGPVLILNLSLNNIFCLHASAFVLNQKLFILMADSGTGKSTIARYIDEKGAGKRIADDIVPLKIINNKLTVLPEFPQLKLSKTQQYRGDPINKQVVFLFATKSKNETVIKEIDSFSAIKKLISHSVATQLFAKNELQKHLSFCHSASQVSQTFLLNYQHSPTSLAKLLRLLREIS